MASVSSETLQKVRNLIHTCPIIDNHAHNLLHVQSQKTADFLTITTEATGSALQDTPKSLAHSAALKQLRILFGLPADADWDAILQAREKRLENDPYDLMKDCIKGTEMLLIDDGLGSPAEMMPYDRHNMFTHSRCKRIVRIEAVAAEILSELHRRKKLPVGVAIADDEACKLAWFDFLRQFDEAIANAITDPEVVGFKSVVCYRTGLDVVVGQDQEVSDAGFYSFQTKLLPHSLAHDFRIEAKGVNDALVISTCKLISAAFNQTGKAKPLQFHTGLGDNDISLLHSNPAYLQPLIKAFPTVPIVLLHSAYPYTREAGYLATVYKNVYLDIGEVTMMVSRDGLKRIFKQALELTPTSKLLYSTDGHHFPETYWLANAHGRQIVEEVLCKYIIKEDITVHQAIEIISDFFFNNSNQLYNLGLTLNEDWMLSSRAMETNKLALDSNSDGSGHDSSAATLINNVQLLETTLTQYPNTRIVFVQWLDFLAQLRCRCLPLSEFHSLIQSSRPITISTGNLGTLQNDHMSSVCNPIGSICVVPDVSSTRQMQDLGPVQHAVSVMANFNDESGNVLDLCPRGALQRTLDAIAHQHKVQFLVGFEIEITFCKRDFTAPEDDPFSPLDTVHAWGTLTDQQYTESIPLMLIITYALRDMGIQVQQMHSETGAGQYEFVLPPLPPVAAVDTLIQARQAITQIAATRNLRATCHPQPFEAVGTAAHAHISFHAVDGSDVQGKDHMFMASVLEHMSALCAFTMPQADSYKRVVADSWTGGTWIAWGTQNREVPLRRVGSVPRWEVRCLDGFANMYLALHAILGAGLLGLEKSLELRMADCQKNPSKLSDEERQNLGITKELPKALTEAIDNLKQDSELESALSPGIVQHYLALKLSEQEMLNGMSEAKRRVWLMERY